MSGTHPLVSANMEYAKDFGEKANLAGTPSRKIAVLACMDTRLEPEASLGLKLGEANIIRNAGGRASDDAIRSLIVSTTLLGSNEIFIVHHTDCGMESRTNEQVAAAVREGRGPAGVEANYMDWLSISGQPETLIEDVTRVRHHPLINPLIPIYGYLIDVKTGLLIEVSEALQAGKPLAT